MQRGATCQNISCWVCRSCAPSTARIHRTKVTAHRRPPTQSEQSTIHKFALADAKASYAGTSKIPGHLSDDWLKAAALDNLDSVLQAFPVGDGKRVEEVYEEY